MYTSIAFIVDTTRLPAPGTYQKPAWTTHFPMSVTQDTGGATTYQPGTIIRVGMNDRVDLSFVDASLGLKVALAPTLILAHTWQQVGQEAVTLKPSDLADDNPNKPIDKPRFDLTHPGVPKMRYSGDETGWTQVQKTDQLYWPDGAKISQSTTASLDILYGPYATFNLQGWPGVLTFGVGFSVSKDGKTVGYYYFDPQIQAA